MRYEGPLDDSPIQTVYLELCSSLCLAAFQGTRFSLPIELLFACCWELASVILESLVQRESLPVPCVRCSLSQLGLASFSVFLLMISATGFSSEMDCCFRSHPGFCLFSIHNVFILASSYVFLILVYFSSFGPKGDRCCVLVPGFFGWSGVCFSIGL